MRKYPHLKELYKQTYLTGIKNDPRGRIAVKKLLLAREEEYKKLPTKLKQYYDKENFVNPYSDVRLLYDNGRSIKRLAVGIDVDDSELVLLDRLNEHGKKIDGVMAHHPEGMALARLNEVAEMQADLFVELGVSISVAEALIEMQQRADFEYYSGENVFKTIDAATHLNFPLMCAHTASDNLVMKFLKTTFKKQKPETLQQIMDILLNIEEYQIFALKGQLPYILLGKPKRRVRNIFVDMTGGLEAPGEIWSELAACGVDTVILMHCSEAQKEAMSEQSLNVVVAGHIASDTLGMNLLLDILHTHLEYVDIFETSGFVRIHRKGKK